MNQNINFDNEVLAYLSVRKDELIQSHTDYIASHPEIREVLNDFISSVLLHKPVSSFDWLGSERCFCVRQGVLPPIQPQAT